MPHINNGTSNYNWKRLIFTAFSSRSRERRALFVTGACYECYEILCRLRQYKSARWIELHIQQNQIETVAIQNPKHYACFRFFCLPFRMTKWNGRKKIISKEMSKYKVTTYLSIPRNWNEILPLQAHSETQSWEAGLMSREWNQLSGGSERERGTVQNDNLKELFVPSIRRFKKISPKTTSRVCDQLRHNFEWTKYIELNRITVQIHTFSPAIQTNSSVNIPRSFLIKKRIAIKKNSLTLCIRHLSKC